MLKCPGPGRAKKQRAEKTRTWKLPGGPCTVPIFFYHNHLRRINNHISKDDIIRIDDEDVNAEGRGREMSKFDWKFIVNISLEIGLNNLHQNRFQFDGSVNNLLNEDYSLGCRSIRIV